MHALSALRKENPVWQIYRDETSGRVLLVVKMEPEQVEVIMQGILETGFSRYINYYLCKS